MKQFLFEQDGISDFLIQILEKHPDSAYILEFLSKFIKNSGCKRIEFAEFSMSASGASLHDRVLINKRALEFEITQLLYVIFHEIAHQYQYKKYGIDKIYGMYTGEISVKEGAKLLQEIENIADEFAIRKLRELKTKTDKLVIKDTSIKKVYENVPISVFEMTIEKFIKMVKNGNYKDKVEISEILYNNIIRK